MKYSNLTQILHCSTNEKQRISHAEITPVYHSTAYIVEDTDDYDLAQTGQKYCYNRTANPNRDELAASISLLENGDNTLVCSSGMAAISTSLLSLLKSGDHILFNREIYGETIELAHEVLANYNIEISFANFRSADEVKKSIRGNTRILYTEVISNPLTHIVDLGGIAETAHRNQALLVVDNTFTTPVLIRPLDFGADVVIHSLTKYFGGHSDVTGGSITASDKLIEQIRRKYLLLGCCLDANSCWLVQRSLLTLSMRVKKQFQNALKIAEFLSGQKKIREVYYPGLATHPQHELAHNLMGNEYGAMLSFRMEDDLKKVDQFIHRLKIIKYLGTLGGIRTSLAHPATAFKHEFTEEQLQQMGLYDGHIRISVGIENPEDLIKDLSQALEISD